MIPVTLAHSIRNLQRGQIIEVCRLEITVRVRPILQEIQRRI
jgi:hypothetical protein